MLKMISFNFTFATSFRVYQCVSYRDLLTKIWLFMLSMQGSRQKYLARIPDVIGVSLFWEHLN